VQNEKGKTTYGFLDGGPVDSLLSIKRGQNFAGYALGIVTIYQNWYVYVPGNVQNAETYKYPVLMKAVEGLSSEALRANDRSLLDKVIKTAKYLETHGCRAVIGACGFFGNFQREVAQALDIPVAMSSLCQVPWILRMIKPDQKIGILTADADNLTYDLLSCCGVTKEESERLAIKGLCWETHFSAIMQEDRGHAFNNEGIRAEVVAAARTLQAENPDIGAFLLECSDMPPYAADVQRAVELPVFDFITMANYLVNATRQRPYEGWL